MSGPDDKHDETETETVDIQALPLEGAVYEFGPQPDGRVRVTFKNLSAVYYVDGESPHRSDVMAALAKSQRSGDVVKLTYALVGKKIVAVAPA